MHCFKTKMKLNKKAIQLFNHKAQKRARQQNGQKGQQTNLGQTQKLDIFYRAHKMTKEK